MLHAHKQCDSIWGHVYSVVKGRNIYYDKFYKSQLLLVLNKVYNYFLCSKRHLNIYSYLDSLPQSCSNLGHTRLYLEKNEMTWEN